MIWAQIGWGESRHDYSWWRWNVTGPQCLSAKMHNATWMHLYSFQPPSTLFSLDLCSLHTLPLTAIHAAFPFIFHLSFLTSMFSLSCDQPFYNPSVYYYSLPWEQPDGGSVSWDWMGVALLVSWFSTWKQGLAESLCQQQPSPEQPLLLLLIELTTVTLGHIFFLCLPPISVKNLSCFHPLNVDYTEKREKRLSLLCIQIQNPGRQSLKLECITDSSIWVNSFNVAPAMAPREAANIPGSNW